MAYTVGQAARLVGVSASALRYYDKEGLLPFVQRTAGGVRVFAEKDLEWLRTIECLKKTGMPLRDIRRYIALCQQGDSTLDERLGMIDRQHCLLEKQIGQLQQMLALLEYKRWYYQTAAQKGEQAMADLAETDLPQPLRAAFRQLKCDGGQ